MGVAVQVRSPIRAAAPYPPPACHSAHGPSPAPRSSSRLGGGGRPALSGQGHGSVGMEPGPPAPRGAPGICRGPPLRVRGADRRREERASCRARPAAPDKLAICCCLSSAFVMQIPEPAAGTKLGGGGVFLRFFLFP